MARRSAWARRPWTAMAVIYREAADGREIAIEARCHITPGLPETRTDPACGPEVEILHLEIDGVSAYPSRLTDDEQRRIEIIACDQAHEEEG